MGKGGLCVTSGVVGLGCTQTWQVPPNFGTTWVHVGEQGGALEPALHPPRRVTKQRTLSKWLLKTSPCYSAGAERPFG